MDSQSETVELATQNYREEHRMAAQFQDHAAKLKYLQYRAELSALADDETRHAALLQDWIEKHGGSVPQETPAVKDGRNDWARLRLDYEDDFSHQEKYLHDAYRIDGTDPDLAKLFLSIRKDERRHRQVLLWLVMRHDCYDS